jgi:hypothetical protein
LVGGQGGKRLRRRLLCTETKSAHPAGWIGSKRLGEKMNEPKSKVLFITETGYHEYIWAYDMGENIFKILNSPFFAYGISCQDEIYTKPIKNGEVHVFVGIYKKSGNKTIRIAGDMRLGDGRIKDNILEDLEEMGCSCEGRSRRYKSITIPKNVDLQTVADYLVKNNQNWEYVDPSIEEAKKEY